MANDCLKMAKHLLENRVVKICEFFVICARIAKFFEINGAYLKIPRGCLVWLP